MYRIIITDHNFSKKGNRNQENNILHNKHLMYMNQNSCKINIKYMNTELLKKLINLMVY